MCADLASWLAREIVDSIDLRAGWVDPVGLTG